MIKINNKDPLFAEILWVTSATDKESPVLFHKFLHVLPNCVWASDGKSLHKLNTKQDLLPTGSMEVIKKTKTMLWLDYIEFEQPTIPNFGELGQNYSQWKLIGTIYWIDFCRVIRILHETSKIFNVETFKKAHAMPGENRVAWIAFKLGFPLVIKNDNCEAVVTDYSL